MNFFDYELSRSAANATPPQTASGSNTAPEPTLNEEVSQVVGQLGRLWGGFRKQSQVALESVSKDLTSVVAQAQKEIEHLAAEGGAAIRSATSGLAAAPGEEGTQRREGAGVTSSSTTAPGGSEAASATGEPTVNEKGSAVSEEDTSASVDASPPPTASSSAANPSSSPPSAPASSENPLQALLARAQATLPELERRVLQAAASAQARGDLTALRAHADGLSARSEKLLREAGAYLKEAVRVVPPEEGEGEIPEVALDGMGLGVVVLPPSGIRSGAGKRTTGKGKGAMPTSATTAGARVAAVLARLRREPEALEVDPAVDADKGVSEAYVGWVAKEVGAREGGMEGSYWRERIRAEVEGEDGAALVKTRDTLVPKTLEADTFWTRYFFKVYQVEKDEERRKALLAASGASQTETEEFSWEDDDDEEESSEEGDDDDDEEDEDEGAEESATPSAVAESKPGLTAAASATSAARASSDTLLPAPPADKTHVSYPSSLVTSPTNTSPRESSDGYDVVSENSEKKAAALTKSTGSTVKPTAPAPASTATAKAGEDEESGDSDWE